MIEYKKPRAVCPACQRDVSVTESGRLAAHHCKHGDQCVEAKTGAQVNGCERCAAAAAPAAVAS